MRSRNVTEQRLVQVFLNPDNPSIDEVSTDMNGNLYCTCASYTSRKSCKHCRFVKDRMIENDGEYPLEWLGKTSVEEIEKAKSSNKTFRELIIKFGKIEVY